MEGERGFLGGRRLDLAHLEPPVRRIVLTTAAVLVAMAVAVAVRGSLPGPLVRTQYGYALPAAVVGISTATAIVAVCLLLTGAAHSRSRWRYLVLPPLLVALGLSFVRGLGGLPAATGIGALRALLLIPATYTLICLTVIFVLAPRLRIIRAFWVVLGMVGVFAVAVTILSAVAAPAYGPTMIFSVIVFSAVALEPALLVVGFDLADVATEPVTLGLSWLDRRSPRLQRTIRLGLIGLAVAVIVEFYLRSDLVTWPAGVVLACWFVGLVVVGGFFSLVVLRRPSRPEAARPRYRHLLAVAAAISLSALAASMFSQPEPGYVSYAGLRPYSFKAPPGLSEFGRRWPPFNANPRFPARVRFAAHGGFPTLAVVGLPRPPFAKPQDRFADLNAMISVSGLTPMSMSLGPADKTGWERGQATAVRHGGQSVRYFILRRQSPTRDVATDVDWYVICGDLDTRAAASKARCEETAASFLAAERAIPSRGANLAVDLGFFAAAASAMALAVRRNRRADTPELDLVFWVFFLNALRGVFGYAFDGLDYPFYDPRVLAVLLVVLLLVGVLLAVALEAAPARWVQRLDRKAASNLVLQAVGSLIVIGVLLVLYVFAINSAEASQLIRGAIICLALAWEVATAGETLSPEVGPQVFHRSSRLFMFVGYLLLVATAVFMLADLSKGTGDKPSTWDTELTVANGLMLMGGALVVNRLIRGLSALFRQERPEPRPGIEGAAASPGLVKAVPPPST